MDLQRFDIAFVTSHFSTCDLGHYVRTIQAASTSELRVLRRHIKEHRRGVRPSNAFTNVPNLSTHDALVKVIQHTFRKRSAIRYFLWRKAMPIRQWLVRVFSGLELKNDPNFGAIYAASKRRRALIHMSHRELLAVLGAFGAKHWKFLVTTLLGIVAIVGAWLHA